MTPSRVQPLFYEGVVLRVWFLFQVSFKIGDGFVKPFELHIALAKIEKKTRQRFVMVRHLKGSKRFGVLAFAIILLTLFEIMFRLLEGSFGLLGFRSERSAADGETKES